MPGRRYNLATQRYEYTRRTVWKWIHNEFTFNREYPADDPSMQIYASYTYHRASVKAIRGPSVIDARPFTNDMLDSSGEQKIRELDPFMMHRSIPGLLVVPYIQASEESFADIFLRETYNAHYTKFVQVDVTIDNVSVTPVYFPAYVYSIQYLGRSFYTFINGADLQCSGIRFYNWRRIGTITAIGMAGIAGIRSGHVVGEASGAFWVSTVNIPVLDFDLHDFLIYNFSMCHLSQFSVILPSLFSSLFVLYYPTMSLWLREVSQRLEFKIHGNPPKAKWADAYYQFEKRRSKNEQAQYQQKETPGYKKIRGGDPKGYYKALGVEKTATIQEIRAAFLRFVVPFSSPLKLYNIHPSNLIC